ncbi:MAG: NAD(P)H-hydrate dehydratase [Desulfocapsaceae bacterium]|nr:NAD(P)H-hydrate dehydratase [Desulfocapsaceae bacterium]
MKLPYASEMRELDRRAIEEYGIPGMVLMENAGLSTVLMMEKELGPADNSFALILVGPGNNGGDALVIGRHLHQRGCEPIFIFLVAPEKLQGDAATNLHIVQKLALPLHVLDSVARVQTLPALYEQLISKGKPCYAIIDGLFGTGLTREISGHIADLIQLVKENTLGASIPRIAVDIPSGLHADSGRIQGSCISADHTATYGCAKPGQLLHQGPELCGRLHVIDIGIPTAAFDTLHIQQQSVTEQTFTLSLARIKRRTTSHKGSHGHLLVLAGSIGKTGAAILSVKGALRSGCGLVSLCCPLNLNTIFETQLIEAMTIPLQASRSAIGMEDLATIEEQLQGKQAIVIGPGLGMAESTAQLVLHLYHTVEAPMVIDADALNILAQHTDQLKSPPGPRIFTPHPGEMARILDISTAKIQDNRIEAARTACQLFDQSADQCTVILKGAGTVIVSVGGEAWINTSGNPGMATGGMGDVLSGIIGALICQGLCPHEAARTAVYLHGRAGDMLEKTIGTGYTATELADTLPQIIKDLSN